MEMIALPTTSPASAPSLPSTEQRSAYARLTSRDRAILDEYLRGKTATGAVRAVFPDMERPDVAASRWFKKPMVKAAIAEFSENVLDAIGVTKFMIAKEYALLAFGDHRKLFDANGNLRPMHELSEDEAALIESVETSQVVLGGGKQLDMLEGGEGDTAAAPPTVIVTRKIKRWNKLAALDSLKEIAQMGGNKQTADTIFNVQINY